MKKKTIGIAIALAGIACSVGTSFALYTKAANNVSFGVGAYSHSQTDGSRTYTVTGDSNNTISFNASMFTAGYYEKTFNFTLGGSYGGSLIAQDFIHGRLDVSFSLPSVDGVTAETSVYFTGYSNWGASAFGSNLLGNGGNNVTPEDVHRDITVATAGTQHVLVYLKFSGITEAKAIALAEQAATVTVTFGAPDTPCSKYVVGDASNWEYWEQYRMVPNINAVSEEYIFKGLTGFNQSKCFNTAETGDNRWSGGDNQMNMTGHTYTVTWNGSHSTAAYYQQTA